MSLIWSLSDPFCAPGFIISPSDLSMSSVFGLCSSHMLEYRCLFALFLRSARYFTGAEGNWTLPPPYLTVIFSLRHSSLNSDYHCHLDMRKPKSKKTRVFSGRLIFLGVEHLFHSSQLNAQKGVFHSKFHCGQDKKMALGTWKQQ